MIVALFSAIEIFAVLAVTGVMLLGTGLIAYVCYRLIRRAAREGARDAMARAEGNRDAGISRAD